MNFGLLIEFLNLSCQADWAALFFGIIAHLLYLFLVAMLCFIVLLIEQIILLLKLILLLCRMHQFLHMRNYWTTLAFPNFEGLPYRILILRYFVYLIENFQLEWILVSLLHILNIALKSDTDHTHCLNHLRVNELTLQRICLLRIHAELPKHKFLDQFISLELVHDGQKSLRFNRSQFIPETLGVFQPLLESFCEVHSLGVYEDQLFHVLINITEWSIQQILGLDGSSINWNML